MNGINVIVFGRVREIVGADTVELPVAPGATTGSVLESLVALYPTLAPWKEFLRVALNREYATGERTVSPGDEVAVIPPVSGG